MFSLRLLPGAAEVRMHRARPLLVGGLYRDIRHNQGTGGTGRPAAYVADGHPHRPRQRSLLALETCAGDSRARGRLGGRKNVSIATTREQSGAQTRQMAIRAVVMLKLKIEVERLESRQGPLF